MVHIRINERETNPNAHINFISALPSIEPTETEDARQLLRALAAQVRPVMKAHGIEVNSLEEYEHNPVFAGRNWNNGETIELVLRGARGQFLPTSWLIGTFCHELAHIKHMNHGPAFQALWTQLNREVRELQAKGYYGDGYWSSGRRLADSAHVGIDAMEEGDMPEYMCGGAHSRQRPTRPRRRRLATSSGTYGRQTMRKRKPGTRVTSKAAFARAGEGAKLVDSARGEVGTGFGKRAQSKRAREERAAAVERRLQAVMAASGSASGYTSPFGSLAPDDEEEEREDEEGYSGEGGVDEGEVEPETDQDRRRILLESMSAGDAEGVRSGGLRQRVMDEFILPPVSSSATAVAGASGCRGQGSSGSDVKGDSVESTTTVQRVEREEEPPLKKAKTTALKLKSHAATAGGSAGRNVSSMDNDKLPAKSFASTRGLSYGAIVQEEVSFRRKEALGLAGKRASGTVGVIVGPSADAEATGQQSRSRLLNTVARHGLEHDTIDLTAERDEPPAASLLATPDSIGRGDKEWSCVVCTLINVAGHLACSACATPRGDITWVGRCT